MISSLQETLAAIPVGRCPQALNCTAALAIVLGLVAVDAYAQTTNFQLRDGCLVTAANSAVRVSTVEGRPRYVLSFPITLGAPTRVRAFCEDSSGVSTGATARFTPTTGVWFYPGPILLDSVVTPVALKLELGQAILTTEHPTTGARVIAVYTSGAEQPISGDNSGLLVAVSNSSIARLEPGPVIRAIRSGTLNVSASFEGVVAAGTLLVVLSGDTDGDGLPDDYEIAEGLNPDDPSDGGEDRDDDGLTNLDEFLFGTDPFKADTDGDGLLDGEECPPVGGICPAISDPSRADSDGDGVWDGLELQLGTSPLDSQSVDYSRAITQLGILVSPPSLSFRKSGIGQVIRQQLTVSATMIDGRPLDLTPASRGTTCTSGDPTIAFPGDRNCEVIAGNDGDTTITVSSAGYTRIVPVHVDSFQPQVLNAYRLDAPATDVKVAGNFAYVAATSAGIQVFDASNPAELRNLGSFDTPGTANDVDASGTDVYVADGEAGLSTLRFQGGAAATGRSDTFDGAVIARDKWTVATAGSSALVFQAGGALQFRLGATPAQHAEVSTRSRWQLAGDFDYQLDFGVSSFGGFDQELRSYVTGGSYNFGITRWRQTDGTDLIHSNDSYQGVPGSGTNIDSSAASGQFRVVRTGDLYKSYWRPVSSDEWALVRSVHLGWTGPVEVVLDANSGSPGGPFEGSFDNFRILAGSELGALTVISRVPLAGSAAALSVRGGLAYVVGPALGLAIVDLTQAPTLGLLDLDGNGIDDRILGTVPTLGGSQGVDADGNLVAVGRGGNGVTIIDISDPRHPVEKRTVATTDARGLAMRDGYVYVADGNSGLSETLKVIDARAPSSAAIVGRLPGQFFLTDVALQGPFLVASDVFFFNSVPVVDVSDPTAPRYSAQMDFRQFGDHNGVGVDAARGYVFMVGAPGPTYSLFVGQFAATDGDRTAPSISITHPSDPSTASQGSVVHVVADALDEVGIDRVEFRVDGAVVATDSLPPFEANIRASAVTNTMLVDAVAQDLNGNTAVSAPVRVNLQRDFVPPSVAITRPASGESHLERTRIRVSATAADDVGVQRVEFRLDGILIQAFATAPYDATVTVPSGESVAIIEARAFDQAGNSFSDEVRITVLADQGTTVVGRVFDEAGSPVSGATVNVVGGVAGLTDSEGSFSLSGAPTALGPITAHASKTTAAGTIDGLSVAATPVPGGSTDVGDIQLSTLFGDGHDGALATTTMSQVVNVGHRLTQSVEAGVTGLVVESGTGFKAGDEVLVVKMQGLSAGTHEFGRLISVSDSVLALASPLRRGYDISDGAVSVISVPNFTNVTVQSGTSLTTSPWDGSAGGILVFRASGTLSVEPSAAIVASGLGYKGGNQVSSTNPGFGQQGESFRGKGALDWHNNFGGGGGSFENVGCCTEGAGGGGFGRPGSSGADGSANGPGQGGISYGPDDESAILVGSGGGSGECNSTPRTGGTGGGAIVAFARNVINDGTLITDGGAVWDFGGGGGGGGGGGLVLLVSDRVDVQNGTQDVRGGEGGCGGSPPPPTNTCGGRGGDGRLILRAREVVSPFIPCAAIPAVIYEWWKGDNNVADIIAGHDGSWRGTSSFVDAEVGPGIRLNGGNAVFVAQNFVLHELTDATLEFWVNPDNPFFDQAVFWTRPDSSDANRFNILVNGGQIIMDYREPNGNLHYLGAAPVTAGGWTHIAIVRTILPTYVYRIYRNGELASEVSDPIPNLPTAVGWTMSGRGCCMFRGILDEVSTYRRALTQSEIRDIFQAGEFGKCRQ